MDLKGLAGKKGVREEGVRGGEGHACIVGERTWDLHCSCLHFCTCHYAVEVVRDQQFHPHV